MMKQQQWSSTALTEIRTVMEQKSEKEQKKFKTHCKKAAGLIQRSGLIQALCFLRGRQEQEMGDYFCDALSRTYGYKTSAQLTEKAQRAPLAEYLMLTRDTIEIAIWFRRFAQIEMAHIQEETNED